jgi:hypothetical protein
VLLLEGKEKKTHSPWSVIVLAVLKIASIIYASVTGCLNFPLAPAQNEPSCALEQTRNFAQTGTSE